MNFNYHDTFIEQCISALLAVLLASSPAEATHSPETGDADAVAEIAQQLSAAELAELWRAYDDRLDALHCTGVEMAYQFGASKDEAQILDRGTYAFAPDGKWLRDVERYRTDADTGETTAQRDVQVSDGSRVFRHAQGGGGAIRFDFDYPSGYTSVRQGLGRFLLSPSRSRLPDHFLASDSLERLADDPEGRPRIKVLVARWEGAAAGVWVHATLDPAFDFAPRRLEPIDRQGLHRRVLIEAHDYRFVGSLALPHVVERTVWRSLGPQQAADQDTREKFAEFERLVVDLGLSPKMIEELGYDHPDVLAIMHEAIPRVFGDDGLPTRVASMGVYRFEMEEVLAVNDDVPDHLFAHRYKEGGRVWDEFTDRLYTFREGLFVPTDPDTFEESPERAVALPSLDPSNP